MDKTGLAYNMTKIKVWVTKITVHVQTSCDVYDVC